jgi:hypothetical protein
LSATSGGQPGSTTRPKRRLRRDHAGVRVDVDVQAGKDAAGTKSALEARLERQDDVVVVSKIVTRALAVGTRRVVDKLQAGPREIAALLAAQHMDVLIGRSLPEESMAATLAVRGRTSATF